MKISQKEDNEVSVNEITLKELILKGKEVFIYLLRKWKFVLLFAVLGAALGFYYAKTQKMKYIASLTFVLEDNKSNGLGAYSGIANQFGVDLGGMGGGGIFAGDNILQFLRSRLMVEKALLSEVRVNYKPMSLANLYLEIYDWRKILQRSPLLKKVSFPLNQSRSTYSLQQDSILNVIYRTIIKENLSVLKPDKKLNFIEVKCKSEGEIFSKVFTETLVNEATEFYILTKIKRSKSNVDKLQAKADSIKTLLNKKTYSAAVIQDLNANPARRVATVNAEMVMGDKVILQAMYAEVNKNLEISRTVMTQETPIIQVIDSPLYPLDREKLGKLKGIVIGGFLGGLLITLFFTAKLILTKILA